MVSLEKLFLDPLVISLFYFFFQLLNVHGSLSRRFPLSWAPIARGEGIRFTATRTLFSFWLFLFFEWKSLDITMKGIGDGRKREIIQPTYSLI